MRGEQIHIIPLFWITIGSFTLTKAGVSQTKCVRVEWMDNFCFINKSPLKHANAGDTST